MMDYTQARLKMVAQQLRTWDVNSASVLEAFSRTPRERFVPPLFSELAYADIEITLPHGECMLAPKTIGRALEALALTPTDTVLQIGTGTGYVTALLAQLVKRVCAIEMHPDFASTTELHLTQLGLANVTLQVGNGLQGWEAHAPYDAIIFTGSLPALPPALRKQLTAEGRIFAVVGCSPAMEAAVFTPHREGNFSRKSLFETDLFRLKGISEPSSFVF